MRTTSLLLAWLLTALAGGAVLAQSPHRVRMTRFEYKRGLLEISVVRPVITAMPNGPLQARINRTIAVACPPGGLAEWQRRAREGEDTLSYDMDARVTLNKKGVLSIHWQGLEMHSKNGQVNEAHPTKHFAGLTLDMRTGKSYSLAQLFRPGSNWRDVLDRAIARQLAADEDLKDMDRKQDEFLQDVRAHTYSYYLTPKGLGIYNIYSNFALGAIQATVPYSALTGVEDPNGPLGRLP